MLVATHRGACALTDQTSRLSNAAPAHATPKADVFEQSVASAWRKMVLNVLPRIVRADAMELDAIAAVFRPCIIGPSRDGRRRNVVATHMG
jgi:hypothetical protein